MKKLFAILFLASFAYGQTLIDTVLFTRPANATQYTAGDIVRASSTTGGAFIAINTLTSGTSGSKGYITSVGLYHDTSNAPGGNFTVIFFKDTASLYTTWAYQLPADNAAYQSNYGASKYRLGSVSLSFSAYGTAAGGATMAGGSVENINIPFTSRNGKLYAIIVCDGAYTPKNAGVFRLHVGIERTY